MPVAKTTKTASAGMDLARTAASKLAEARERLTQYFIERDDMIEGLMIGLVGRIPVLLDGPPGTAKSALARSMARLIDGKVFIKTVMGESTMNEFFGSPVFEAEDKKDLLRGYIRRNLHGSVVEADVVLLDEKFRGGPELVSSFLTVMEEREFHNGPEIVPARWSLWIAATNWIPQDEEMQAIVDRYVLRFQAPEIRNFQSFIRMLSNPDEPPALDDLVLSRDELQAIQDRVFQVEIPNGIIEKIAKIRATLSHQNLLHGTSPRRWKKILRVLRARAALLGRDEVEEQDLRVVAHCLWNRPDDLPKILQKIEEIIDQTAARIQGWFNSADEVRGKWDRLARTIDFVSMDEKRRNEYMDEAAQDVMRVANLIQDAVSLLQKEPSKEGKAKVQTMKGYHNYIRAVLESLSMNQQIPAWDEFARQDTGV